MWCNLSASHWIAAQPKTKRRAHERIEKRHCGAAHCFPDFLSAPGWLLQAPWRTCLFPPRFPLCAKVDDPVTLPYILVRDERRAREVREGEKERARVRESKRERERERLCGYRDRCMAQCLFLTGPENTDAV